MQRLMPIFLLATTLCYAQHTNKDEWLKDYTLTQIEYSDEEEIAVVGVLYPFGENMPMYYWATQDEGLNFFYTKSEYDFRFFVEAMKKVYRVVILEDLILKARTGKFLYEIKGDDK